MNPSETPALTPPPGEAPPRGAEPRLRGCRFCGSAWGATLCDLGMQPLANAYLPVDVAHAADATVRPEPRWPLAAHACSGCGLVQLDHTADPGAIFGHYAYLSSVSPQWLAHAQALVDDSIQRFGLHAGSRVVEAASNDGYLLRRCVARGIPCLGIEPAANVAARTVAAGIPTECAFLDAALARRLVARDGPADLVFALNVLAHVPTVADFAQALLTLAGARGTVVVEVPHLLRLVEGLQFDTIYHEHYFYWSLQALQRVFAAQGGQVYDVQALPTHGGSLRLWIAEKGRHPVRPSVAALLAAEQAAGLADGRALAGFQARVDALLAQARGFMAECRRRGWRVAAYGAAAKGNTLLNALGAGVADIACVADRNPLKQGCLLPGSRIPVVAPEALLALRPDIVWVLPWNLLDELRAELAPLATAGTRLAVAVPALRLIEPPGAAAAWPRRTLPLAEALLP